MTDRIDTAKERDSWMSWIDDLPLPHEFHEGQDGLQEFIARTFIALEAERARAEIAEKERNASLSLQPLWMNGDVTPQLVSTALAQLWEKLGASNQTEACGNIDKLLAEARLEGWRAGLQAAAAICDGTAKYHMSDPDDIEVVRMTASEIRNQPIPKEFKNEY